MRKKLSLPEPSESEKNLSRQLSEKIAQELRRKNRLVLRGLWSWRYIFRV